MRDLQWCEKASFSPSTRRRPRAAQTGLTLHTSEVSTEPLNGRPNLTRLTAAAHVHAKTFPTEYSPECNVCGPLMGVFDQSPSRLRFFQCLYFSGDVATGDPWEEVNKSLTNVDIAAAGKRLLERIHAVGAGSLADQSIDTQMT